MPDDAGRLVNFRRNRDDCTTLNLENVLEVATDIYPPSSELTQENEHTDRANVLDVEVSIHSSVISTKVYCKTDSFPFDVISLPFLDASSHL